MVCKDYLSWHSDLRRIFKNHLSADHWLLSGRLLLLLYDDSTQTAQLAQCSAVTDKLSIRGLWQYVGEQVRLWRQAPYRFDGDSQVAFYLSGEWKIIINESIQLWNYILQRNNSLPGGLLTFLPSYCLKKWKGKAASVQNFATAPPLEPGGLLGKREVGKRPVALCSLLVNARPQGPWNVLSKQPVKDLLGLELV